MAWISGIRINSEIAQTRRNIDDVYAVFCVAQRIAKFIYVGSALVVVAQVLTRVFYILIAFFPGYRGSFPGNAQLLGRINRK